MAAARGIVTHEARAEALPFAPQPFDGVLMALTPDFSACYSTPSEWIFFSSPSDSFPFLPVSNR